MNGYLHRLVAGAAHPAAPPGGLRPRDDVWLTVPTTRAGRASVPGPPLGAWAVDAEPSPAPPPQEHGPATARTGAGEPPAAGLRGRRTEPSAGAHRSPLGGEAGPAATPVRPGAAHLGPGPSPTPGPVPWRPDLAADHPRVIPVRPAGAAAPAAVSPGTAPPPANVTAPDHPIPAAAARARPPADGAPATPAPTRASAARPAPTASPIPTAAASPGGTHRDAVHSPPGTRTATASVRAGIPSAARGGEDRGQAVPRIDIVIERLDVRLPALRPAPGTGRTDPAGRPAPPLDLADYLASRGRR